MHSSWLSSIPIHWEDIMLAMCIYPYAQIVLLPLTNLYIENLAGVCHASSLNWFIRKIEAVHLNDVAGHNLIKPHKSIVIIDINQDKIFYGIYFTVPCVCELSPAWNTRWLLRFDHEIICASDGRGVEKELKILRCIPCNFAMIFGSCTEKNILV